MRKTYTGIVTKLEPNQIYVFESDISGKHDSGSSLHARELFGAIEGQAYSMQGHSYAIAMKFNGVYIPREHVVNQIRYLYYAATHNYKDKEFLIASRERNRVRLYTDASEITAWVIPENIIFEEQFQKLIDIL